MSLLAADPHLRRWTLYDPVPVKHPATTGLYPSTRRDSQAAMSPDNGDAAVTQLKRNRQKMLEHCLCVAS